MSVGKRIYLKRNMPDPEIVEQFKSIPAGEDEVIPDWEKLPDEFVGDISDFTTGINPVIRTIDNDGTHQYYDLSGRKLNSKPQKGIYIDNGKKRVVYRR